MECTRHDSEPPPSTGTDLNGIMQRDVIQRDGGGDLRA